MLMHIYRGISNNIVLIYVLSLAICSCSIAILMYTIIIIIYIFFHHLTNPYYLQKQGYQQQEYPQQGYQQQGYPPPRQGHFQFQQGYYPAPAIAPLVVQQQMTNVVVVDERQPIVTQKTILTPQPYCLTSTAAPLAVQQQTTNVLVVNKRQPTRRPTAVQRPATTRRPTAVQRPATTRQPTAAQQNYYNTHNVIQQPESKPKLNHVLHLFITIMFHPWIFVWITLCIMYEDYP